MAGSEEPAPLTLACRGFHGVWEAGGLDACVRMIKSGSVSRVRVSDRSFALDRAGVQAISNALNSQDCAIETLCTCAGCGWRGVRRVRALRAPRL
jgi:hypothetical protein